MVLDSTGFGLLIVDDDVVDQRRYGRLLAEQVRNGWQIVPAMDAAAGLRALREQAFKCVLLDFNLPDLTGCEFLAAAAVDGELPCAFVLITGHGSEDIAVEAMKRGVQDYLSKDRLDPDRLWRAITAAVTQTELRQRLARSLHDLSEANAALEREAAIRAAADSATRAARDAAERANQAKTRFVAMVTHELRTPLNGILGYAQLLRIEGGLSARQAEHVDAMQSAGHHLLDVIERVLDFSAIECGKIELNLARISVRALADTCITFIGPLATHRGLGLRLVIARNAPAEITADAARLRQVLLNLLSNAVKYTDTGRAELRIRAGSAAGAIRMEVADTGRGINEAKRDRLFQDFERLEVATTAEGAGLGLVIAARLVSLMGGKLNYRTRRQGGSAFWFELRPRDLPRGVYAPESRAQTVLDMGLASRRILLVDDMAMNRDVIGGFLRAAGHVVATAESGEEAVEQAMTRQFDLILMDVRMPHMDGLEACRRIRALPSPNNEVPVLALTAYTFTEQVAQCADAGMDGYVSKPVDYETLTRAIASVARRAPGSAPASHPPTDAEPETAGPPAGAARRGYGERFDRTTFDQTISFIPRDEVVAYLTALRGQEGDLLRLLDDSAETGVLARAAHSLASTAGQFGFNGLSVAARRFEHAAMRGDASREQTRLDLRSELAAALPLLDAFVCQT